MLKYRVHLQTVAMTTIEVEAADKDEAYDKALNEGMPHICAQCSGWGNNQNLELNDDWDISEGSTVDESVEEVSAE